jgi:aspartate/methionine/tyrosine aminotransferase
VRYAHPIGSSDLAERLRDERSVLVVAGDHFEMDGYLRIGFGSNPDYLTSALTLIGEFLRTVGAHAR